MQISHGFDINSEHDITLERKSLLLKETSSQIINEPIRMRSQLIKSFSKPILVVDDEDMNVLVLQTMLKSEEYESDAAYSGQTALELFKKRIKKVRRGEADMY